MHLSTRRKARIEEFDLDAEVAVQPRDRDRLEDLCRYIHRPPIALDRLTYLPPGPCYDGTTHVSMTPRVFLGRLASLVPRPKKNTNLYFGVLAGHAGGREKIVPEPKRKTTRCEDSQWAALMKNSFGIDVLSCRRCKGRMKLVAVIFDKKEVRRLLQNLRVWSERTPRAPGAWACRRARDLRVPLTAAPSERGATMTPRAFAIAPVRGISPLPSRAKVVRRPATLSD